MKVKWWVFAALLAALLGLKAFADLEIDVGPTTSPGNGRKIPVPRPADDTPGNRAVPGNVQDVLRFLNKDALHGRVVAVDAATGLVLRHANVKDPIVFGLKNVNEVVLAGRIDQPAGKGMSRVELTNGDHLLGTIVELSSDKLTLDTWYAGPLSIERPMVKSISPNININTYIYEGPTGLEGWVKGQGGNQGTWKYKDGVLFTDGGYQTLGRDMKLPDMAKLEFNLAWRGQLNFYMYLYTDRFNQYGGNAYMFYISYDYVYMQRCTQNGGSSDMGNQNINGLNNRGKAKFTLLVDKSKKKIACLIDGLLAKEWVDAGDFAGKGTGIMFYPQNNSRIKLSGLRISKWDGSMGGQSGEEKAAKEDVIRFQNNDKVSGELKTIKDGTIAFNTAYATLTVPLARAVTITLSEKQRERARRSQGDVRAFFRSGGAVTVNMTQLKNDELEGASENFGKARFKLSAFEKIMFNVYAQREEEEKDW